MLQSGYGFNFVRTISYSSSRLSTIFRGARRIEELSTFRKKVTTVVSDNSSESGALRPVMCRGHRFLVADTHSEFWEIFSNGTWEPATFEIFDHYLNSETVYLDVGAWIGPTALYAATRARQVLAFEPDPVAFASLLITAAANAGLAPIQAYPIAIAPQAGEIVFGSNSEPGDSMSSSLFAKSENTWTASAKRLEDFEQNWPEAAPLFVKVDVEGGEYELLPALHEFIKKHRPTLYLSLHSHYFLGSSVCAPLIPKLLSEMKLFGRFLAAWKVLRKFKYIYNHRGTRVSVLRLLHREIWRRTPTLLLAQQPLPKGFRSGAPS